MSTSKVNNNQVHQVSSPHPHRWKALGILSLAQFLIILDTFIIGIALPTIQQHFSFSQANLQWIFNAYVIVFGALLLLGGHQSRPKAYKIINKNIVARILSKHTGALV